MSHSLTHERLTEKLTYDPETGAFLWRNPRAKWQIGVPAGNVNKCLGYRQINIDKRLYYAHRLAWLYVHGMWPAATIDHVDGNRDNNRLANLRAATYGQNNRNRGLRADNRFGCPGLQLSTTTGKWLLQMRGKHLGVFESRDEAIATYKAAAEREFGEFFYQGEK